MNGQDATGRDHVPAGGQVNGKYRFQRRIRNVLHSIHRVLGDIAPRAGIYFHKQAGSCFPFSRPRNLTENGKQETCPGGTTARGASCGLIRPDGKIGTPAQPAAPLQDDAARILARATRELIMAAEAALPFMTGDRTALAGRIALAHAAVHQAESARERAA